MVDTQIDNLALAYLSEAVEEELEHGLDYQDIVTLIKNVNGDVTAIVVNMAEVNRLQAGIAKRALVKSDKDTETYVDIPITTILGENITSGRGPKIRIKAVLASDVVVRLKSSFSTAGINQTYHRISVEATMSYKYFIPGKWHSCAATSEFVVAETVILGSVPDTYTYFGESYSKDSAMHDYYLVN